MRVLLLSPSLPYPIRSGAEQRTNLLYRALSERAHVDLVMLSNREPGLISTSEVATLQASYNLVAWHEPQALSETVPWSALAFLPDRWIERVGKLIARTPYGLAATKQMRRAVAALVRENTYDLVVSRYLLPVALVGTDLLPPVIIDVDDFP